MGVPPLLCGPSSGIDVVFPCRDLREQEKGFPLLRAEGEALCKSLPDQLRHKPLSGAQPPNASENPAVCSHAMLRLTGHVLG